MRDWALVVGGSGGIGSAIAAALADDGHDVVVTYGSNHEGASAVAEYARGMGRRAEVRKLRLPGGDAGSMEGLKTLVFAAGADIGQSYLSQVDPDALREAVEIEVHGFFAVVQAALPELRKRAGSVVAVSSAGLGRFPPGDVLSVAPKAAAEALVKAIAREEGRYGVRANAVAVGVVKGGLFERIDFGQQWLDAARKNIPLRRFAEPREVAEAVVWLASGRASYVTGQTLFVDGGYAV